MSLPAGQETSMCATRARGPGVLTGGGSIIGRDAKLSSALRLRILQLTAMGCATQVTWPLN